MSVDNTEEPTQVAAAAVAEKEPATVLTDEEGKRKILAEYHPDLCGLEEVEFGTKDIVHPHVHYRAQDNKEYFVFYTPQFQALIKILYSLIKEEKKFDGWGLLKVVESKPSKLPKIPRNDDGKFFTSDEYDATLKSSFAWNYTWFSKFAVVLRDPAVIERCRVFRARCNMHCYLSSALNQFGLYTQDLEIGKLSVVTIDKEARIAFLRSLPEERYRNVELELQKRASSSDTDLDQVVAIDKILDETKKLVQPRASTERQVDYCFALNRANFYLSCLEKDLRNKDLKTLEAMDKLRRKINFQLLEYRFISEQNATPLFNLRIDHCKVIVHNAKHTVIFLEREQAVRFKKSLETSLDTKAQNITSKYSLDATTGTELRRIAETINPATSDDLLHEMDRRIADMKASVEKKQLEGKAELLRIGLKVGVNDSGRFAFEPCSSDVALLEDKKGLELDDDQLMEIVKLADVLPQGEESKQDNRVVLANSVKQLQVSPDNIDCALNGFKCFVECKRLQVQAEAMQQRRNKFGEKREYMIDYINMIKLYTQLERGHYGERTDYEGVLIEEIVSFEKNNGNELFAEYTVRDI